MALDPAAAADATVEAVESTGATEEFGNDHYAESLRAALEESGETDAPEGEAAETEGGDATETAEAAPAKKPEPEKPKEPEADRDEAHRKEWSAISRERKKAREREEVANTAIAQAGQYKAKAEAHDSLTKRLVEDPRAVLIEYGGEALIDKLLDSQIASEKSPAEREIAKLRQEIEASKREQEQRAQVQAVQEWRDGVVRTVEAGGEKYDLVNSLGQHEAVIEVMASYYTKYKAPLPVEIAAEAVEKTLAANLGKSKKFGPREPVKNTQTPAKNGTQAPAGKKPATASLSSLATGEIPGAEDELPMDPNDRFQQVMRGIAG